jgi:ribosomal protein L3 glutamine methyltransferase
MHEDRQAPSVGTIVGVTVIELVQAASARLQEAGVCFGHGTTCAWDEAAWLVLWRLGLPLHELDDAASRAVSPLDTERVRELVEQRIQTRRPAAYLTGEAWLQGVPFTVDERAIVPRSLIAEVLAEGLIDAWLGREPAQVLDLCTGNGSLAVLAALAWPQAQVDAADLSAPALEVAALNRQRHGLTDRIALHQGDSWQAVSSRRYDLVLCNPPYVNTTSMASLPPEYRSEPTLALAGGDDGMDFIRPLLSQWRDHLLPGGALVLEIGHERSHFEHAFPSLEPIWLPCSAGDDQVLLLSRETL